MGTRLSGDERREHLLHVGVELVGRHGTADISIEEIARAAGVSKGLLYHYFPTKTDFFLAVLARSQAEMDQAVVRDRGLTPFNQTHTFVFSGLLAPRVSGGGIGAALINHNQLGFIVQANSGLPFNIRANRDLKTLPRPWHAQPRPGFHQRLQQRIARQRRGNRRRLRPQIELPANVRDDRRQQAEL